jgi:hypothetical protein
MRTKQEAPVPVLPESPVETSTAEPVDIAVPHCVVIADFDQGRLRRHAEMLRVHFACSEVAEAAGAETLIVPGVLLLARPNDLEFYDRATPRRFIRLDAALREVVADRSGDDSLGALRDSLQELRAKETSMRVALDELNQNSRRRVDLLDQAARTDAKVSLAEIDTRSEVLGRRIAILSEDLEKLPDLLEACARLVIGDRRAGVAKLVDDLMTAGQMIIEATLDSRASGRLEASATAAASTLVGQESGALHGRFEELSAATGISGSDFAVRVSVFFDELDAAEPRLREHIAKARAAAEVLAKHLHQELPEQGR